MKKVLSIAGSCAIALLFAGALFAGVHKASPQMNKHNSKLNPKLKCGYCHSGAGAIQKKGGQNINKAGNAKCKGSGCH